MCARHDDLQRAIADAVEAQAAGRGPGVTPGLVCDPSPRRRVALWEQSDNVHCSILGTCASVDDLRRTARKVGIEVAADTPDYDIHGHFVRLSATDCAFSRAFQRLLDQRFEGALRRVGRSRGEHALAALWREMCDRGQVAAAYWSFMTQAHVPPSLRASIFGEVHMLSHLARASVRRKTEEASALREQLAESEDRARRIEAGLKLALCERDREISDLRATVTTLKAERDRRPGPDAETAAPAAEILALRKRLEKAERAIESARNRAQAAEARLAELEGRAEGSQGKPPRAEPAPGAERIEVPPTLADPSESGRIAMAQPPRSVLYVGGMHGHRDRLRGIAEAFNATFVHHDGGVEDAPQRLDSLLPSVDCVFCPVNCVSHDACLRAKKICQKLNKPFVPLRSPGQGAFRKALQSLVAAQSAPQIEPDQNLEGDPAQCTSR